MNELKPGATIENGKNLETTVAIIGSGFSGLGMAIQLRKRRRDDFLILEKSHDIGGAWRDNTYPGCGCDVPTAIYSYSFEQNPYWSKMWSSQPEIHAYLQRLTDKYDLRRKAVFGTEIIESHWDEALALAPAFGRRTHHHRPVHCDRYRSAESAAHPEIQQRRVVRRVGLSLRAMGSQRGFDR